MVCCLYNRASPPTTAEIKNKKQLLLANDRKRFGQTPWGQRIIHLFKVAEEIIFHSAAELMTIQIYGQTLYT